MKKLIIVITVLFFCISAGSQERRLALVIGNGNYTSSTLSNPENDAKALEKSLKTLGFNVVKYENLTQKQLTQAIDDFGNKLKNFDVGLFFYAGHGIQSKGFNYLIPVDAVLKSESDIEYNCVRADRIFGKMDDAQNDINIIILDACRDNPFERSWTRAATGQGLTFMDAPRGSIIAYATSPGKTASDGYAENSPYTSALITCMEIPNIKIEDFFKKVRSQVREQTKDQQIPWESTSLEGDFYFQHDEDYVQKETKSNDAKQTDDIIDSESRTSAVPEIKSMVILPFANYSGDESQAYLGMGLQDALISEIGQLGTVRVISKTSTLSYANTQKTIQEIAYELNVDAIMEASIITIQDNIRLHLKLYKAYPEEKQIWSKTFDSDMSNIFNLYSEVVKEIAKEIQLTLSPQLKSKLAKNRQVNPKAYDAYMNGVFYFYQFTPDAFEKALEYFNLAIEHDPEWGPAYGGIALFWIGLRQFGLAPSTETIPNIYKYLDKLNEFEPGSANTHYINGLVAVWTGFDWEKGEKEFLKALELNPNDAYAMIYYAHLLMCLKRNDEALLMGQKALELDPLNIAIQTLHSVVLYCANKNDQAITLAEKILKVVPDNSLAISILSITHYHKKEYKKSIDYLTRYFHIEEAYKFLILSTVDEKGYIAAYEMLISKIIEMTGDSYPMDLGQLYQMINNYSKAIYWYEKAYEDHDANIPYLGTRLCSIGQLTVEPGYIELMQMLKLPLGEFE